MIARQVTPGLEAEFEEWAAGLTRTASRFRGFLGAGMLLPGEVGQPWHIVYRFDSQSNLDAWERSSERAAVLDDGAHLVQATSVQRVTGLETWFALPGFTNAAPARWKMFLVSGACIFCLQFVIYSVLGSLAFRVPLAVRLLLVVSLVTAAMTWAVMPGVARLLAGWLYPDRVQSGGHRPVPQDGRSAAGPEK